MGDGDEAELNARLRALPSVQRLAAELDAPPALAVAAARAALAKRRARLRAGGADGHGHGDAHGDGETLLDAARAALARAQGPSLRRVLNATGVIVHTNLGRAPLCAPAREALTRVAEGYSNLEWDADTGTRGSRQAHVQGLLRELTNAEAALVVNNGAAAALLAVAALAGPGRGIVVSRGQLVEIGGSFRIPEVIAVSGARLIEVGTTNRTRLADYQAALAGSRPEAPVSAILRVHPSNFRAVGFVAGVEIEELCGLGVPVIDDVGSGVLGGEVAGTGTLTAALADEPSVARSVAAGAALVCCSADKLLGGPQAGLLVGRAEAVERARAHPLTRALRIDKLSLAALEATLRVHLDPARARRELPVPAMLDAAPGELEARARRLCDALARGGVPAELAWGASRVGGGALPLLELGGPIVRLPDAPGGADALATRLRAGDPPVVGRIRDGALVLDPRTLSDAEVAVVAGVVCACWADPAGSGDAPAGSGEGPAGSGHGRREHAADG